MYDMGLAKFRRLSRIVELWIVDYWSSRSVNLWPGWKSHMTVVALTVVAITRLSSLVCVCYALSMHVGSLIKSDRISKAWSVIRGSELHNEESSSSYLASCPSSLAPYSFHQI